MAGCLGCHYQNPCTYTRRNSRDEFQLSEVCMGEQQQHVCWVSHQTVNMAEDPLCQKMIKTLKAFKNGDLNIIVSTSVLEEGVDIRICNLVIRFDKPKTFRPYVQSRGRPRVKESN